MDQRSRARGTGPVGRVVLDTDESKDVKPNQGLAPGCDRGVPSEDGGEPDEQRGVSRVAKGSEVLRPSTVRS